MNAIDLRLLDAQFALAHERATPATDPRIVIVGIDPGSAKAIPEPMTLWHASLGRFLEALRVAKPKALAIDLVLPDRSFENFAPGLDSALVRALVTTRAAFPTVLAQTVDEGGLPRTIYPAFVAASGVEPGYALWPVDHDGVIRRFDERLGQDGETVPTLAGQVARLLQREAHAGYIDFSAGAFDYVPFIDVIAHAGKGDGEWLRERFEGRVVYLGSVLPLVDTVRLPVRLALWGPPAEATPGVLLQAHALRVLLDGRMIAPAAPWIVALLALVAAFVAGAAARLDVGTASLVAALIGLAVAAHLALASGVFVPLSIAAMAAIAGWGVRQGVAVAERLLERRRLRQSFAGYVSPAVMSEILEGRLSPDARGEQSFVCVMFSDIRGYTTRSEGMKAADLLAFLNRYFDGVVGLIHQHGGTVICFMGDGIMAAFGAPQGMDNACDAAFRTAKAMVESLRATNAGLVADGLAPIDIGIGLHAGEAVLGHVGGRQRHDYSVIGDVTNVASRLESATKEAGYRIVVSDDVAQRLPDRTGLVALGPMNLKGHTPVEAHGFDPVAASPVAVRS